MKEIVVKSLDELDALVAEHVMAQKRSELLCCRCGGSEGEHHVCGQEHIFEPEYERYSQDIAAAWPVVEWMILGNNLRHTITAAMQNEKEGK